MIYIKKYVRIVLHIFIISMNFYKCDKYYKHFLEYTLQLKYYLFVVLILLLAKNVKWLQSASAVFQIYHKSEPKSLN